MTAAAISGTLLLLPLASFFLVYMAMTRISPNNYVNDLAGNGLYGFGSKIRLLVLSPGKMNEHKKSPF